MTYEFILLSLNIISYFIQNQILPVPYFAIVYLVQLGILIRF